MKMEFDKTAILVELIPVAIQVIGILAFLYISSDDHFQTFVAITLSFMWLRVSKNELAEEYGGLLLNRHLFGIVGDWLDRSDPLGEYDKAQAEFLMLENSIDDDQYKILVTAAGIGNMVRSTSGILLTLYMLLIIAGLGGAL